VPFGVLLALGLFTWRRGKDRSVLAVALGLAGCTAVMQGLHFAVAHSPLPQSMQFVLLAAASSLSLWATAALLDRFVLQGNAPKLLSGEPGWGQVAALGAWVQVTGSIRLAFLLFPLLLLTGGVGLPQMPVEQFIAPGQPLVAKLALFLVAAVLAPMAEERLFRGVLLTALMRTLSPGAAVFGAAVVFGTLHQGYGLRVALVVFLGLVFGQLRLSSGGLKASIALHMTWNAAISLVLFR
jgi:membrane protease YdiL (CAAX protease family)